MSLLAVKDLSVSFVTRNGTLQAVQSVSLDVRENALTAIIGESGSGKSVLCYALLGLIPTPPGRIDGGEAWFAGQNLLTLSQRELRRVRGAQIGMIFQDPMTSLNPFLRIGEQLTEPLLLHTSLSKKQARARSIELLEEVGLQEPEQAMHAYPFEFSGGMRQRVMIAMALINEPKLLIADEPTTALDVTIQAQILELIKSLQASRGIGVLFISHDLAVVAEIADEILVMEKGLAVESGRAQTVLQRPEHPYTKKLLASVPNGAPQNYEAKTSELLRVTGLKTWFYSNDRTQPVRAVNDVTFSINKREVLGLVGESGSGKSTLGRSLLRLVKITAGAINFDGIDIDRINKTDLKVLRRRMQMIFQDPYSSLNPRMTVFDTLAEPLLLHNLVDRCDVGKAVRTLMDNVGLASAFAKKYPHEFSGGQRQRIAIGRAIATKPEFIVADEPVSALDVTIQAQILKLLAELKEEYGITMLFVSHDLAVIRQISDRVAVMFAGQLEEIGPTKTVFDHPQSAYTRNLLESIPAR
ncbi:MAG: ABC transporter ATP-binding protein [Gammaproteobacteria bacterium]|jgi:ABC-type microcin C transport system duplicated ATPase subunit YejF|nr:ABC transporter ATP-binding protein [Gammaproteobacteria bacterium]